MTASVTEQARKTQPKQVSHFSGFLTVYLLFKCRFVAWQRGFPWKFAYCVSVSKISIRLNLFVFGSIFLRCKLNTPLYILHFTPVQRHAKTLRLSQKQKQTKRKINPPQNPSQLIIGKQTNKQAPYQLTNQPAHQPTSQTASQPTR